MKVLYCQSVWHHRLFGNKVKQKHVAAHQVGIPESDYLYVSESQLPNSGRGLYTAITLYREEEITLFKGEVINENQIAERVLAGVDQYFIALLDGSILDCMETECFAKYANDAIGYASSIHSNNSKITINETGDVCLTATKKIEAGTEIFCGYGKRYWKKHSVNNKISG